MREPKNNTEYPLRQQKDFWIFLNKSVGLRMERSYVTKNFIFHFELTSCQQKNYLPEIILGR